MVKLLFRSIGPMCQGGFVALESTDAPPPRQWVTSPYDGS